MQKPKIICVDDQREVLATLKKDLEEFIELFKIEYCESAEEAYEIIEEIDGNPKISFTWSNGCRDCS